MNLDEIDAYLTSLSEELRKRGVSDVRFVEEARGHLIDAVEQGIQRGLDDESAQREAVAQFGSAASVARTFVSDKSRWFDRVVLLAGIIVGIAIAYVDASPNWDDTAVTAFSLVVAAAMCGFIAPRQPWRWALAVGVWIPVVAVARSASLQAFAMLIVLAFPLAGAYAGMALRRALLMRPGSSSEKDLSFHDRRGFHFLIVTRHGAIDPELAAIVNDPDTHLVPFLERAAPAPLGPLGRPESITGPSDSTNARVRKYQVVFGGERKVICDVEIGGGNRMSVHWQRTPIR